MEGPGGANTWIVSYAETLNLLNIISQPGETVPPTLQPIVNFPGYWYNVDHSDAEAIAAAVAWVQDQTGRTPTAQYWEIGNEVFGPWEAGWFSGMRGSYYGDKFADFYISMKAANPTIKIGAVAQEYDTADWWNPGLWTRELLTAAYAKGVVPDFLIIHQYPGSDQPASYNPTMLGARVNDIASFTTSLNNIISSAIGSQHVGKIRYWMTEWDSGSATSYDRRQCYTNAMFHAQYIMEMAKNNWQGSNAWAQWEYSSSYFVYPVWYVHPLLINRFGRNMFSATSSNSQVRAYAARDNDNNLTIFIVNNYPSTDANITVNISGFTAGTGGQRWLITPAGTMISGGVNIQDYCDVNINGVVHPNPLMLNTLTPQAFTSGGTFNITLPMSGMAILKIPNAGDVTPPAAPTGLTAAGDVGQITLDWNNNGEGDLAGYNVYRSLTSGSGYTKINNSLVTSSDFNDTDVTGGVTYYYIVTAVDTSFNESADSAQTSDAAVDTTPPLAPTGLNAASGDGMVTLNWNDNVDSDLDGYNVYRSTTSGSGYVQLNGSLLTNSDYMDNSVINETTYFYVVTAVDAASNESGYSNEVWATPNILLQTIYNFTGINAANTNYNAFACDVDVFPFAGSAANRNSQVEATNTQYINISADDAAEWATVDPSTDDEILLWVEMKINELPANISRIELTFDGYTGGASATTHRIYALTTDANWIFDTSWTQIGSDQSISPGAYASMTRTITSNFSDYIDVNGKITWAVYETTPSEAMHVNYLEAKVYRVLDTSFPATPTGLAATPGLGTIMLDWNDNNELDLAGYNVWRMPEGGSYEKANISLVTVSNYTDPDVASGTTYYYFVTAVDVALNESDPSGEVTAMRGDAASGAGAILREWWTGINGTAVSNLTSNPNYPNNPTDEELLISLEGPVNWADNYGTRIRGYLNPVTTGSYIFWIAGDDNCELWLSTDGNPANVSRIAYVPGYTSSRQWTKYAQQQSSPIMLTSGQKYYIDVLHKEGGGGDSVAVAWQGPGIAQQIIDGLYLSPYCLDFENFADFAQQWQQAGCNSGNNYCYGFDFNRSGSVTLDDLMSFADAWLAGI